MLSEVELSLAEALAVEASLPRHNVLPLPSCKPSGVGFAHRSCGAGILTKTPDTNLLHPRRHCWRRELHAVRRSSSIHPDNHGKRKCLPLREWHDSTDWT